MISANLIRKISEVEPNLREILILILEEVEKHTQQIAQQVTKQEFTELKDIVSELAKAQKQTEQRISELADVQRQTEHRPNDLAEAQKQTEQKLNELAEAQKQTEQKLNELAEAQKQTEQRINELAKAQKQTEQRLNELAEAQKQTEQRINKLTEIQNKSEERLTRLEKIVTELAEAQKQTEEELKKLTHALNRTNKQLGGLSRSVAYALENEAYRHLPHLLKSLHHIEVTDRFIRTYISNEEINIFAKAKKNGKDIHLVGEVVLKLDDRTKLRQVMKKVQVVKEEIGGEVVPIIVTHFAKPDVLERANKAGIIVIQSFEW